MSDFISLAQTFGLAVALLIALCIFIWRVLIWLKPWAEKLFTAHLDLVHATKDSVSILVSGHQQTANTLSQIASTQQQQASLLSSLKDHFDRGMPS